MHDSDGWHSTQNLPKVKLHAGRMRETQEDVLGAFALPALRFPLRQEPRAFLW
jgi:hypothetical protein